MTLSCDVIPLGKTYWKKAPPIPGVCEEPTYYGQVWNGHHWRWVVVWRVKWNLWKYHRMGESTMHTAQSLTEAKELAPLLLEVG